MLTNIADLKEKNLKLLVELQPIRRVLTSTTIKTNKVELVGFLLTTDFIVLPVEQHTHFVTNKEQETYVLTELIRGCERNNVMVDGGEIHVRLIVNLTMNTLCGLVDNRLVVERGTGLLLTNGHYPVVVTFGVKHFPNLSTKDFVGDTQT